MFCYFLLFLTIHERRGTRKSVYTHTHTHQFFVAMNEVSLNYIDVEGSDDENLLFLSALQGRRGQLRMGKMIGI